MMKSFGVFTVWCVLGILVTSMIVMSGYARTSSISSADLLAAQEEGAPNGYQMTMRDRKVIAQAKKHINDLVNAHKKEKLVKITATIIHYSGSLDDAQSEFLLSMIGALLKDALEDVIEGYDRDEPSAVADFLAGNISINDKKLQDELWNRSDDDETVQEESVNETDTVVVSSVIQDGSSEQESSQFDGSVPPAPPTPDKQMSLEEFLESYYPFLMDTSGLVWRCYEYYDAIDHLAKQRDFPTSLIIATWFREHSCYMSNPGNGYGNFQITSHYYTPGEIDLPELLRQVDHFIDFSHAKWNWYDAIQVFGPEPVRIAYNRFDLNSIRKQAILYNGVYPNVTLTNSWYSNENFTQSRGGRDGIVAVLIKVLDRAKENGKM